MRKAIFVDKGRTHRLSHADAFGDEGPVTAKKSVIFVKIFFCIH
jgi:hypothetical protein